MSTAPVSFQREPLGAPLWAEVLPLLAAHHREVAPFPDAPPAPDFDAYASLGRADVLRCFTARQDERLVGYALFIVHHALHRAGSLEAVQDVLYLDPAARGVAGRQFLVWCDDALAGDGVQLVHHFTTTARDFGPLLERLGYRCVQHVYARDLRRHG